MSPIPRKKVRLLVCKIGIIFPQWVEQQAGHPVRVFFLITHFMVGTDGKVKTVDCGRP